MPARTVDALRLAPRKTPTTSHSPARIRLGPQHAASSMHSRCSQAPAHSASWPPMHAAYHGGPATSIGRHIGHLEAAAHDKPRHVQQDVQVVEKRCLETTALDRDAFECGCATCAGASLIKVDEPTRASVLGLIAKRDRGLEPMGNSSAFRIDCESLTSYDRMVQRLQKQYVTAKPRIVRRRTEQQEVDARAASSQRRLSPCLRRQGLSRSTSLATAARC